MTKIIAVLVILGQFDVAVQTSKGYFVAAYPDTEIAVVQHRGAVPVASSLEG